MTSSTWLAASLLFLAAATAHAHAHLTSSDPGEGSTGKSPGQIVLTFSSVTFTFAMGIGNAGSVRVGLAVGARDTPGARRAGLLAFAAGAAFMGCAALTYLLFPSQLAALMTNDPAIAARVPRRIEMLDGQIITDTGPAGAGRAGGGAALGRRRRLGTGRSACSRRRGVGGCDDCRVCAESSTQRTSSTPHRDGDRSTLATRSICACSRRGQSYRYDARTIRARRHVLRRT